MKKKSKYEINYLRFLTGGKLPDKILQTLRDLKVVNRNTISFTVNIPRLAKDWRCAVGSNFQLTDNNL